MILDHKRRHIYRMMPGRKDQEVAWLRDPGRLGYDFANDPGRPRAHHRLLKRPDGKPRCVACMLCATACPAQCITISADEEGDKSIEKYPRSFGIDLLRCVFCGLCVEACPCDAIRMDTGVYDITAYDRKSFVVDREKLLSMPPMAGIPDVPLPKTLPGVGKGAK